jgi:AcrR family transcriptional regulator
LVENAGQADASQEPLSRRERRRLEIRERIVETAIVLFEAHGYEATTVHEIAERADVAYGTFFRHFPTKHDLLRELSDRALRDLFTDVEEIRKRPGSFTDHFIALFEGTAERADKMSPNTRGLLRAMLQAAYPEKADADDRRMRSAFRIFMDDGFAAGALRDDVDPETLIEVVIGTWYSMFRSWVYSDDYPLRERAASAGRFLAATLTSSAHSTDPV